MHLVLFEEWPPGISQRWTEEPTVHPWPQRRLQHLRQQIHLPSLLVVELDNHVEVVLDEVFAPSFHLHRSHHQWMMSGA